MVGKDSESEVAEHLYELIQKLHAIDSSVMLAVMPQLEFKLKVHRNWSQCWDLAHEHYACELLHQLFHLSVEH